MKKIKRVDLLKNDEERDVYYAALVKCLEELEKFSNLWNDGLDELHWELLNDKIEMEIYFEKKGE